MNLRLLKDSESLKPPPLCRHSLLFSSVPEPTNLYYFKLSVSLFQLQGHQNQSIHFSHDDQLRHFFDPDSPRTTSTFCQLIRFKLSSSLIHGESLHSGFVPWFSSLIEIWVTCKYPFPKFETNLNRKSDNLNQTFKQQGSISGVKTTSDENPRTVAIES